MASPAIVAGTGTPRARVERHVRAASQDPLTLHRCAFGMHKCASGTSVSRSFITLDDRRRFNATFRPGRSPVSGNQRSGGELPLILERSRRPPRAGHPVRGRSAIRSDPVGVSRSSQPRGPFAPERHTPKIGATRTKLKPKKQTCGCRTRSTCSRRDLRRRADPRGRPAQVEPAVDRVVDPAAVQFSDPTDQGACARRDGAEIQFRPANT